MSGVKLFFEHAKFAYYFSLLYGVSPIRISKENNQPSLKVHSSWYYIAAGHCTLNLICVFIIILDYSDIRLIISFNNVSLDAVVYIICVYKVVFIPTLALMCKFTLEEGIKDILMTLTEIDNALQEFNIRRSYLKDTFYQVLHILLVPIAFAVVIIIKNIVSEAFVFSAANIVFEIHVCIMANVMDAHFALLMYVVRQNFAYINKCLQEFVDAKEKTVSDIRMLRFLHERNCDVVTTINFSYGYSIAACTSIHLSDALIYSFFAYKGYELGLNNVALFAFLLSLMHLVEMVHKNIIGHTTTNVAKVTKHLVHKALLRTRDKRTTKDLMIFSKQILHCPIRFSSLGVFHIDGNSIVWIVGFAPVFMLMMFTYQQNSIIHCTRNITSAFLENATHLE